LSDADLVKSILKSLIEPNLVDWWRIPGGGNGAIVLGPPNALCVTSPDARQAKAWSTTRLSCTSPGLGREAATALRSGRSSG